MPSRISLRNQLLQRYLRTGTTLKRNEPTQYYTFLKGHASALLFMLADILRRPMITYHQSGDPLARLPPYLIKKMLLIDKPKIDQKNKKILCSFSTD